MTDPVAQLTFTPADPEPVLDGVLYQVTGPVLPQGRIVLKDGEDRIRGVSPVFSQRNKLGGPGDAEVFVIATDSDPDGGDFTLQVYDSLGHVEYEATAVIAYDYVDGDVESALEAVVGAGNVDVTDGIIVFGGDLPIKGITVRVDDNLENGTVAVTKSTVEAQGRPLEAGGPYYWGPVYIPKDTSIVADLVATADDEDLGVYEGDSLLEATVEVYDFGDL